MLFIQHCLMPPAACVLHLADVPVCLYVEACAGIAHHINISTFIYTYAKRLVHVHFVSTDLYVFVIQVLH